MLSRRQGGRHAGRATTDDAHISRGINLIEMTLHSKIRVHHPQAGRFTNIFNGQGPDFRRFMQGTVVKTGRHGKTEIVHKGHGIYVRCFAGDILSDNFHSVPGRCVLHPDIGHVVYLHHRIAAFAIQAI